MGSGDESRTVGQEDRDTETAPSLQSYHTSMCSARSLSHPLQDILQASQSGLLTLPTPHPPLLTIIQLFSVAPKCQTLHSPSQSAPRLPTACLPKSFALLFPDQNFQPQSNHSNLNSPRCVTVTCACEKATFDSAKHLFEFP